MRRLSALVALSVVLVAGPTAAQPKKPAPKPAPAEPAPKSPAEEAYERHMSVGVRLFRAGDFKAALAEFEAAYQASPKASPLINQALCYRELNRFTKAVGTLELALSKHGAEMSEADKREAERAIEEMKAVFGYVTVRVTPADATVKIDDEEIAAGDRGGKIALTPGDHVVEVAMPGYANKRATVRVVSGSDQTVDVELSVATGTLRVIAAKKTTPIEVDGKIMGSGTWTGPLPAGPHEVRAVGESGVGRVEITAGGSIVLDLTENGGFSPLPPVPKPAEPKKPAEPEVKRGFYGSVNGAILIPTRHPQFFDQEIDGELLGGVSSGGYVGLRPGYRVHTPVSRG